MDERRDVRSHADGGAGKDGRDAFPERVGRLRWIRNDAGDALRWRLSASKVRGQSIEWSFVDRDETVGHLLHPRGFVPTRRERRAGYEGHHDEWLTGDAARGVREDRPGCEHASARHAGERGELAIHFFQRVVLGLAIDAHHDVVVRAAARETQPVRRRVETPDEWMCGNGVGAGIDPFAQPLELLAGQGSAAACGRLAISGHGRQTGTGGCTTGSV